jgi:hypothetical protein
MKPAISGFEELLKTSAMNAVPLAATKEWCDIYGVDSASGGDIYAWLTAVDSKPRQVPLTPPRAQSSRKLLRRPGCYTSL